VRQVDPPSSGIFPISIQEHPNGLNFYPHRMHVSGAISLLLIFLPGFSAGTGRRDNEPVPQMPNPSPQSPPPASSLLPLAPPFKAPPHTMSSTPRIILHGGAGSISRTNVPPDSPAYQAYVSSLRQILTSTYTSLLAGASALDAACSAVVLFEDNPLFNCGKGAVFTRAGKNELEASVMVSSGYGKRGVGVALLRHVKNPILFAKEMLKREDERHNFLSGEEAEKLAKMWGLEIVDESWFWTERRWREHLRGLEKEGEKGTRAEMQKEEDIKEKRETRQEKEGMGSGKQEEYLPQGTVGCVVMDKWGVLAVATSTGGMTNKLPGRIGDTPTLGAGFWAEEWELPPARVQSPLADLFTSCLPTAPIRLSENPPEKGKVAMSGTGNGDYFLRIAAAHNVAGRCRFGGRTLETAVKEVVGKGGEMQQAAEGIGRWGTGEGEGGFVAMDQDGTVVWDLNCGGMFRGYVDEKGETKVAVYWDEEMY
jgi:L-asparaginase